MRYRADEMHALRDAYFAHRRANTSAAEMHDIEVQFAVFENLLADVDSALARDLVDQVIDGLRRETAPKRAEGLEA